MEQDLKQYITHILRNPNNIDGQIFIKIYNIVFFICTEEGSQFEIKGRKAYDILSDCLHVFVKDLPCFTSIKILFDLLSKYSNSLEKLKALFFYLERYYIKSCIDKRDGYVLDVFSLFYFVLYRNYLEKYTKNFYASLFFEIESIKSNDFEKVKFILQMYKQILFANEEEKVHKKFIFDFVSYFKDKIDFSRELSRVLRTFHKFMKLCYFIFDATSLMEIKKCFYDEFIDKKDEIIEFILYEIPRKRPVLHYYDFLCFVDYKDVFIKKFKTTIKKEFTKEKNVEKAFNFFKFLLHVNRVDFLEDETVFQILCFYFYKFVFNNNKKEMYEFFDSIIIEVKEHYFNTLSYLLLFADSVMLDEMYINMTKRIVFDKNSYDNEIKFLMYLENSNFDEFRQKCRKFLREVQLFEKNFKIICGQNRNDEEWIDTKVKLFKPYHFDCDIPELKPNIEFQYLIKMINNKYKIPESVFFCFYIYNLCTVEIKFCKCNIKMTGSQYFMLKYIEKNEEVTFLELCQNIGECSEYEIEAMVQAFLLKKEKNCYKLNYDYMNGDKTLYRYDYNYGRKINNAIVNIKNGVPFYQALIVKVLKRNGRLSKSELLGYVKPEDYKNYEESIEKLIEQEFIEVLNDTYKYIP